MKTGIYKILNKRNNKVYIGSAIDIKKRWRDHKWHLNHNKHHNSHLQSAWNKFGENSFVFLILIECDVTGLLTLENEFIVKHNANNNKFGYNINDPEHIFLNRKHSKKTKEKLSIQKLGNKNPMYGKRGILHPKYGKSLSAETKEKISKKKLGVKTNKQTNVKLNTNDVISIRKEFFENGISQPKISKKYCVSYATINKIITKKTWTHI